MTVIYVVCPNGWPHMPVFATFSLDGKAREKESGFCIEFSAFEIQTCPSPSLGVNAKHILLLGLFWLRVTEKCKSWYVIKNGVRKGRVIYRLKKLNI